LFQDRVKNYYTKIRNPEGNTTLETNGKEGSKVAVTQQRTQIKC
jgi:hypothetical protein